MNDTDNPDQYGGVMRLPRHTLRAGCTCLACLPLAYSIAAAFSVERPKTPCNPTLNVCEANDLFFRPPDAPEDNMPGGRPPTRSVTMTTTGSVSISSGYVVAVHPDGRTFQVS